MNSRSFVIVSFLGALLIFSGIRMIGTTRIEGQRFQAIATTTAGVCGDSTCNAIIGENASTCPADCPDVCPDTFCTGAETCSSCAADCGGCSPSPGVCGDSVCDTFENASSCPADCPDVCGDTFCTGTETCSSCSADCGTCSPTPGVCGDSTCDTFENASTCPADCPDVCGDTFCTGLETCSSCSADCGICSVTPSSCGDGVVDFDEDCDDGSSNSDTAADACRTDCSFASCGDGVIDTGEDCDDGTSNSDTAADACRTTCVDPSCGDSVVDSGETCDPGITSTTDPDYRPGCRAAGGAGECTYCGDSVIDSGEQCDNGMHCEFPSQGPVAPSITTCTSNAGCTAPDTCEPRSLDGCSNTCQKEYCCSAWADQVCIESGRIGATVSCPFYNNRYTITNPRVSVQRSEMCVIAGSPDDTCAGTWSRYFPTQGDCAAVCPCGNGVREPLTFPSLVSIVIVDSSDNIVENPVMEACDDGESNGIPGNCSVSCGGSSSCGNSVVEPGEDCDDGNTASNDGCSALCENEYCCGTIGTSCIAGSVSCPITGIIGPPHTKNQSVCNAYCLPPSCGDGTVDVGEECDSGVVCDGGTEFNKWCDDAASTTACIAGGGQCNGDVPGALCRSDCTSASCGDGIVDPLGIDGVLGGGDDELCDEGSSNSDTTPDACRTDCSLPSCGDGVVDTANLETCDEGSLNSDALPTICLTTCKDPGCGDGIEDADGPDDDASTTADNEACDDATHCDNGRICSQHFTCIGIGDQRCVLRPLLGSGRFCSDGTPCGIHDQCLSIGDGDCRKRNDDGCRNNCTLDCTTNYPGYGGVTGAPPLSGSPPIPMCIGDIGPGFDSLQEWFDALANKCKNESCGGSPCVFVDEPFAPQFNYMCSGGPGFRKQNFPLCPTSAFYTHCPRPPAGAWVCNPNPPGPQPSFCDDI